MVDQTRFSKTLYLAKFDMIFNFVIFRGVSWKKKKKKIRFLVKYLAKENISRL